MNNKHKIIWQDNQNKVLQIVSLDNLTWWDILESALEALDITSKEPHDVVLFYDSYQYPVDTANIGSIKDVLFNQLPQAPKNLKGVVILVPPSQKVLLDIGIGVLANARYGRNFMQVVGSYEAAKKLCEEKLRNK